MKRLSLIFLLFLFNIAAWVQVWGIYKNNSEPAKLYFLNVGQGDSELIDFGDVQFLIDGGPNAQVLSNLEKILSTTDRYIDLIILTHPHLDHFGGLIDVFQNYEVGIFMDNGMKHEISQYKDFQKKISNSPIQYLTAREGDKIKYKNWTIEIIAPLSDAPLSTKNLKDIHDKTIVFKLKNENFSALFTGDINFAVEEELSQKYKQWLSADLLKVSHHGSKNSTSDKFLKFVKPKIAVIGVGKNSYGHPNPQAINRIKNAGASIYTTIDNGLIKVVPKKENLHIFSEKY